jgi:parvulin-like peptidyl-prolyl isomerase
VKPEDFPAFSLKSPNTDTPDAGEIVHIASDMAVGEVSAPEPTADGSVLIYVSKRLPVDEKEFKQEKPEVVDNLVRMQQYSLFQEWLKLRRAAAQVKVNYSNS